MLATCVLDAKVASNPALGKFKLLIEAIRNRYAAFKAIKEPEFCSLLINAVWRAKWTNKILFCANKLTMLLGTVLRDPPVNSRYKTLRWLGSLVR